LSVTLTGNAHDNFVNVLANNAGTEPAENPDYLSNRQTPGNEIYFTTLDCPFSAQNIQQSRTNYNFNPVVSRLSLNFFYFRIVRNSLLAQECFSVAKSAYTGHYSYIQSWGYYIYQLQKLLI
jgi:hypothetical protein